MRAFIFFPVLQSATHAWLNPWLENLELVPVICAAIGMSNHGFGIVTTLQILTGEAYPAELRWVTNLTRPHLALSHKKFAYILRSEGILSDF